MNGIIYLVGLIAIIMFIFLSSGCAEPTLSAVHRFAPQTFGTAWSVKL